MPFQPSIQVNRRQLERLLRTMDPKRARRIVTAAVNRTARTGRARISRGVRQVITLRTSSINRRIRVFRAFSGSAPLDATARIDLRELQPPGLISFQGARQSLRSGVTVKVRRDEPKERHPAAFILSVGGTRQVFTRAILGGKRVSRLPLEKLVGPSPIGILIGKPGFLQERILELSVILEKQLDGAIKAHLERGR